MNYYEELGVARSASIAEIRQAYKALVRVLHPDHQQDQDLRRLSELQLRRLNHMLEVLTDPLQRRQYDRGLDALLPVLAPGAVRQKVSLSEFRGVRLKVRFTAGVCIWLLIGIIAVASGIYWVCSPDPVYSVPLGASQQEQIQPATPEPPDPADQPKRVRIESARDARTATPEASVTLDRNREGAGNVGGSAGNSPEQFQIDSHSRPGLHEGQSAPRPAMPPAQVNRDLTVAIAKSNTDPVRALPASPPVPPPGALISQPNQQILPTASVPKVPEDSISGKWLYVPKHDETRRGMYPPEYIEMHITRRAGLLQGRYHGKYKVTDRPISSEVNFQFEGKQEDGVSVLAWFGNDGASGQLRLKRISDDSIQVNWVTTQFGSALTLASGTAVLYRSE